MRCVLVWLFFFEVSARLNADSSEEIKAVEDAAINQRTAITTFHVRVEFKLPVNGFEFNLKSAHYYREKDLTRMDTTRYYLPQQRFSGLSSDEYHEYRITSPKRAIFFDTLESPSGGKQAVEINQIPEDVRKKYADAEVIDIRSIGFHPSGFLLNFPIDDLLRNYGALERTMEDEEIDGIPCKKISLNTSAGSQCAIWIAPSRGFSPLRCVARLPQYDMSDQTDVVVSEWNGSGLWFPTASKYVRTMAGKIVHHEEAVIHVESLNQPLPAETFELAGLDIPVGRAVVMVPEAGPLRLWDGKNVITAGSRRPQAQVAAGGKRETSWILIVNATVLAFVCVFLSLRYVQSRIRAGGEK